MRSYEDYYTPSAVRGQDVSYVSSEDPKVLTVGIYYGIRLQTTFMANNRFYHTLGFMTMVEIIEKYRQCETGSPSPLKINNHSDLARLGVIRELSFSIIPVDPSKTIPPYGTKSNTTVPYAVSKDVTQVVAEMYSFTFVFGSGASQCAYRIEPGSIKEKKSRKTTPHFA